MLQQAVNRCVVWCGGDLLVQRASLVQYSSVSVLSHHQLGHVALFGEIDCSSPSAYEYGAKIPYLAYSNARKSSQRTSQAEYVSIVWELGYLDSAAGRVRQRHSENHDVYVD